MCPPTVSFYNVNMLFARTEMELHLWCTRHVCSPRQVSRLHKILKPFMLRRVKKDVEHELAPKLERVGRGYGEHNSLCTLFTRINGVH